MFTELLINNALVFVPGLNGDSDYDKNGEKYSKINTAFLYNKAPLPMLTYEELMLIRTECYLRLGNYNSAVTQYKSAIDSSFEKLGFPSTIIDPYYNQWQVKASADHDEFLEQILLQKYIKYINILKLMWICSLEKKERPFQSGLSLFYSGVFLPGLVTRRSGWLLETVNRYMTAVYPLRAG